MAYQRNEGHLPDECVTTAEDGTRSYRAVHVVLVGGYDTRKAGAAPWPAKGGRPSDTRWSIGKVPHVSDIEFYEVV